MTPSGQRRGRSLPCDCNARYYQHALAPDCSTWCLLPLTPVCACAVGVQAPGLCAGAQQAAAGGREPQVRGRQGLPALRGAQRCGRLPAPRRLAARQARRLGREQGACARRCRAPRPGARRRTAGRAHTRAGLRTPGRRRLRGTAPCSRRSSRCLRGSAPRAPGPASCQRMCALSHGTAPRLSPPLEPCSPRACARACRSTGGGRRGHALPRGVPGRRGV